GIRSFHVTGVQTCALPISGIETNLEYLQNIIDCDVFKVGTQTTPFLNMFEWKTQKIEVLQAGIQTAVQDVTGRLGYWDVGVPPRSEERRVGKERRSRGWWW